MVAQAPARPKYCLAPNCSNTAGLLGADNRSVRFYKQLEATSLSPGPAILACGPEHLVVLGPVSGDSEDAATLFLTPPPPGVFLVPTELHPGVPSQYLQAELGSALGALLQKVQRLQQCQEQHQATSTAAQEKLATKAGSKESLAFTIICGEPGITVVLAHIACQA
ncbi:LOW QUALITY PROTEIN: THAP domain-containing protein 8 [Glossophaga mutica]